jgi:hypothetical protein
MNGYVNMQALHVQDDLIRGPTMQTTKFRKKSWLPDGNLDVFFTNMYNFYFQRGFAVIVAKHVTSLMYVSRYFIKQFYF